MTTVRARTRIAISTIVLLVLALSAGYWMVRYVVVQAVRDAEALVESAEVDLRHAVAADRALVARAAAALAVPEDFGGPLPTEPDEAAGGLEWVLLAERGGGRWETQAWSGSGDEIDPAALGMDSYLMDNSPLLRPSSLDGVRAGLVAGDGRLLWVGTAEADAFDEPGMRVLLVGMPMARGPNVQKLWQREHAVRFSAQMRPSATWTRLREPERQVRLIAPLGESVALESGGEWHVGSSPYRMLVSLQDVFGTTVGSLAVELSPLYNAFATGILDHLVVAIPLAGIVLTLVFFSVQTICVSRPLTRMARMLAGMAASRTPLETGAVVGNDEFGALARQVSDLLHDLSKLHSETFEHEQTRAAMLALVPELLCIFRTDGTVEDVLSGPSNLPSLHRRLTAGETLETCGLRRASLAEFSQGLRQAATQDTVECVEILVPSYRETPALRIEGRLRRLLNDRVLVAFRPSGCGVATDGSSAEALARQEQQNGHEALVQLVAGIAHDFNNLLVVLQSSLATHMEQHRPANSAPELVAIAQAAKHAEELILQLKVYAGIADTRFESVEIGSLFRVKWPMLRASVPHHIELRLDIEGSLPEVLADQTQILQIVSNLLGNASEAIGEAPGRIQIKVRLLSREDLDADRCLCASPLEAARYLDTDRCLCASPLEAARYLALSVIDTGPGIVPSRLARILDPFFSTKGEGRGLGLAMVAGIIESHSGGLRVLSNLGEGTTFTVFLPVTADEAPYVPAPDANDTEPGRALGVLLIEDDARVRSVTRLLLESLGCHVWEARDGRETRLALQKYATHFDLVLLDANVRGLDGVATLKRVRQEHPGLPVFLTSGDGEANVRRVYAGLTFEGFVAKPFRRDTVAAVLAAVREHPGQGKAS